MVKSMKTSYRKIICLAAALCLFGTALASVSKIDANASAAAEPQTWEFDKLMAPVWEGETSYMESVLPVENQYGGIDPIQLLYPIEEVIEVKNSELTVTYQKGVDYVVAGGKLIIAEDGAIPTMSYSEFHPTTGQTGFEDVNGGYICFSEGDYFHSKQIVVTYTHTETYEGYIPEGKSDLLPNVTTKLQKGEEIDLLVLGDSISVGANSSGWIGTNPYIPTYPELFAKYLATVYGGKVSLENPSVGGKDIIWGMNKINGVLETSDNVDLAVIAFGMNDGSKDATTFVEYANIIVDSIKTKFPEADVMLVATMLPNPDAKFFNLNQANFYDAMVETCEKEGVAVVNMTGVHESLLQRKRYADMTGNNVNHPNDYLARVYAQTLFATLQEEKQQSDCEIPADSTIGGEQQDSAILGFLSGCSGTVSLTVCGVTALGAAAIALNKKKDD